MILDFDQIRRYFETRLAPQRVASREKVSAKCVFHDDKSASMTVFLTGNGAYCCHGCGAKGNVFQFETRFSSCDFQQAERNVAAITGAKPAFLASGERLTASYDYREASGAISFQKRRYEAPDIRKTFRIFRPKGAGWEPGIGDQPKVLFHLPEVITANIVCICEGEKDCETIDQLKLFGHHPDLRVATTTNFEGAWQPGQSAKWQAENNAYFAGKRLVIFEDNDDAGRAWAEYIAGQLASIALTVKVVRLPELPIKCDVSDWMQSHTAEQLVEAIRITPVRKADDLPVKPELLVSAETFLTSSPGEIDWMVDGVIERGSNGFIAAMPKIGKSMLTVDLLLSLAAALPWLGFAVRRPIRCAYVSREDNYRTTQRRLERLYLGKGCDPQLVSENLYLNTGQQSKTLMLDNEAEMNDLIFALRQRRIEIVFLDVFNVMHQANENDSSEMRAVLVKAKRIQTEAGCAVGIVHHFNKNDAGSITSRLRGSSAISGFAEWIIGITMHDEEKKIRKVEFEIKADEPPRPHYYAITNAGPSTIIELQPEPSVRADGAGELIGLRRAKLNGNPHETPHWNDIG